MNNGPAQVMREAIVFGDFRRCGERCYARHIFRLYQKKL